ncbi:MAG: hypothetical protein CVU00_03695 [Bacteroidetes bacterium HGW-Bacteroidetes-17]|jgi:hypothetical protein|nr:MAG: hypothetical protein CVU00_03695 [Bacteroidetes bacterium HGW-Bacteroidetes-17]
MKLKNLLLFLALIAIAFGACKKDGDDDESDLLGANGLPKPVNTIVSEDIINTMKSLGLTINPGDNPPLISGTYLASPFTLKGTNVPGDYSIGTQFADYLVTFSNQNNDNLSITLGYTSGDATGTGIGSYISGSGNSFTVFAKTTSIRNGSSAELIEVISGTISNSGISNFYYANFMLNNNGDNTNFMGNGTGRVLYDSDGVSPKSGNMKTAKIILQLPSVSSK